MRGVIAFGAIGVATASGCLLGSWGEFTSGTGDDAGKVAEDDARAPVEDATISDAAITTDAFDATIDAGGGDTFSCDAGNYLFCATFDDGQPATGWTNVLVKGGGTLTADPNARAGPFALRAQLPAQTDTTNEYASVYKTFTGTKGIRLAFDVKLAQPTWAVDDRAVVLALVEFPGTSNASYLFREVDRSTLSQEQNGTYTYFEPLAYATWTRITVEVVPTTPKGSLRVYYDGRLVLAAADVDFDPPAASPTTAVHVGLQRFDPPSPSIDSRYDSVTIEEIP